MASMAEIAAAWPRQSALFYLAAPSMLSIVGKHAQHIERMRDRVVSVGLDSSVADRIIEDAMNEVDGGMAMLDDEIGRRLYAALLDTR